MAVSFVGSAFGEVAAAGADPLTVDISGVAWADGDIAVARGFINVEMTTVFWAAAGFTREKSFANITGDDKTVGLLWRVLQSGDDETIDFTTGSTAARSVLIDIWRGVDPDNPFDVLPQPTFGSNTQNPTNPAYTTTTANTVGVVWAGITQATPTTAGAPSGYTLRASQVGATHPGRQQELASLDVASPGTQTPGAWTNSGGGVTEESGLVSMALREAGVVASPPIVEEVAATVFVAGTSHLAPMPASVPAGRLLIIFGGFDATVTVTNPTGWNRLDAGGIGSNARHIVTWKQADGTEGGTTVDIVTSASEEGVIWVWMIDNWDETPEFGEAATDDPPSLTASWGAADNLWLTGATQGTAFSAQNVAAPANFQHLDFQTNAGNTTHFGVARYVTDTATVDPSQWLMQIAFVAAWTLVVKGADSDITGTGSSTLDGVTSAGSGTFTPAAITGTGASTLDGVTSAGAGTYTPAAITGAGASTLDGVTSAGSGTFAPPGITGAGASTLDGVTSVGSGTFTDPITGTGASTLAGVTSVGVGFFGDIFLPEITCELLILDAACEVTVLPVACAILSLGVECEQ